VLLYSYNIYRIHDASVFLSKAKQFFSGRTKRQLLDSLIKLQKCFKTLEAIYKAFNQKNAELKVQLQNKKIEDVK